MEFSLEPYKIYYTNHIWAFQFHSDRRSTKIRYQNELLKTEHTINQVNYATTQVPEPLYVPRGVRVQTKEFTSMAGMEGVELAVKNNQLKQFNDLVGPNQKYKQKYKGDLCVS